MAKKEGVSFVSINERIVSTIRTDANEGAVNAIVEKRVKAEVTRRADILEKAVDKYNSTKKEFAGCRPDVKTYAVVPGSNKEDVGVPTEQSAYSEGQWKK